MINPPMMQIIVCLKKRSAGSETDKAVMEKCMQYNQEDGDRSCLMHKYLL